MLSYTVNAKFFSYTCTLQELELKVCGLGLGLRLESFCKDSDSDSDSNPEDSDSDLVDSTTSLHNNWPTRVHITGWSAWRMARLAWSRPVVDSSLILSLWPRMDSFPATCLVYANSGTQGLWPLSKTLMDKNGFVLTAVCVLVSNLRHTTHECMYLVKYGWSLPVMWQKWRSRRSICHSQKPHSACKLQGSVFYITGVVTDRE